MTILLNILVCFGLIAVGIAFIVLLPVVGNVLVSVFGTVVGEQTFARFKGIKSGTVMEKPEGPQPIAVRDDHEDDHHGPASLETYVGVYGALLVLTVATVAVSELGLVQRFAIFWAVVVASIKASLVVAWFMHLKGGPGVNRLVLSTTGFFMLVFLTLTMADLSTRGDIFDHERHWAPLKEAQYRGDLPNGWSEADPNAEH